MRVSEKDLAERVGFEPTLPFRVNTLSKRAPSATRPSLPRRICRRLRLGGKLPQEFLDRRRTRPAIKLTLILWPAPPKPQGANSEFISRNHHPEAVKPAAKLKLPTHRCTCPTVITARRFVASAALSGSVVNLIFLHERYRFLGSEYRSATRNLLRGRAHCRRPEPHAVDQEWQSRGRVGFGVLWHRHPRYCRRCLGICRVRRFEPYRRRSHSCARRRYSQSVFAREAARCSTRSGKAGFRRVDHPFSDRSFYHFGRTEY